jgi:thymidylate kinase
MRLVCITGIDGTGKTTLSRKLVSSLSRQGIPSKYVYGRTYPIISRLMMWLGKAIMLNQYNPWNDYPTYHSKKKQTMRNSVLRWLYSAAIYIDYFPQIIVNLLPDLFSRRIIVMDRYIYDTVINDLAVHLNYSEKEITDTILRSLFVLPVPIRTFLIDIPEEIAFARKNDIPHIDYLKERRPIYLTLKHLPNVVFLNGENSLETLEKEILTELSTIFRVRLI